MLPIDPTADIARRAWLPCPGCGTHRGCVPCEAGRTCPDHWRYLLSNTGHVLHLQCPACAHMWTWDSRSGARP